MDTKTLKKSLTDINSKIREVTEEISNVNSRIDELLQNKKSENPPPLVIDNDNILVNLRILTDAALIPNDSWVYCQYIQVNNIKSEEFFSGYVITDEGKNIPVVNPDMYKQFYNSDVNVINTELGRYDSAIVYKSSSGVYTILGQTLNQ